MDPRKALQDMMEFDHVVRVHPDGTVTDANSESWAPELRDDELGQHPQHAGWSLMTGYTGQYGYQGPVMHTSEFIGGRLADDILSSPGLYVALIAYVTPDDGEEDDDVAGWAVARRLDD